jgi:hypothetical protein
VPALPGGTEKTTEQTVRKSGVLDDIRIEQLPNRYRDELINICLCILICKDINAGLGVDLLHIYSVHYLLSSCPSTLCNLSN